MTRFSLAAQHRQRVLGRLADRDAAATSTAPASPAAPEYDMMVLRLRTDQVKLKALQSIEKRIELKRELLPDYAGWVQGRLDAAVDAARGVQDDVFVTVMMWRIDVGDFDAALPLAQYALRFGLAMPEPFKRGVACYLAEDVAEASIGLIAAGEPAPTALSRVAEMVDGHDMPDEVRAKVHKALGLEALRVAADQATCEATGVPGAARIFKERALLELRRANDLHGACGVKTDIKRLEKDLNKPIDPIGETTAAS